MATPVELPEEQAQAVLLVKAFEEADPKGQLLEIQRRRQATAEALPEGSSLASPQASVEALTHRAALLLGPLEVEIPVLAGIRRITRLGAGLGPAIFTLAFLLGLSTSALGPARRINLLSLPLLGFIAWNLTMYLLFCLVWLVKGRQGSLPGQALGRLVAPLLTLAYLRSSLSRLKDRLPKAAAVAGKAISLYLSAWRQASRALVEARARRLLHLGSLALMAGMVAGMYARGLVFEYRATWESTFLDGPAAWRLLKTLLGPAAQLTGLPIPARQAFEAARGPTGSAEAAPWIHLFAATAILFVVLPRAALVLGETLRIRRGRRLSLDLGGAYYRQVLAAGRGDQLRVEVFPYSRELTGRPADKLQTALLDLFGSQAALLLQPPLEYGEENRWQDEADSGLRTARVVVFNLAQSPELEVHGELLKRLREAAPADVPTLAVVDSSSYRQRLGDQEAADRRLEERWRSWQRALGSTGGVAQVDLAEMDAVELHRRLTAALEAEETSP